MVEDPGPNRFCAISTIRSLVRERLGTTGRTSIRLPAPLVDAAARWSDPVTEDWQLIPTSATFEGRDSSPALISASGFAGTCIANRRCQDALRVGDDRRLRVP
jgi:hypothetical protein